MLYPRRWRPDLVKVCGAGPVSKILLQVLSLLNLDG